MSQSTHNGTTSPRDEVRFAPLRSISALGELIERSDLEPVVVFQHDPCCPISRRAYDELSRASVAAALVDVAQDEALSRAIQQRTGVRHESPQVLVFRSGKVVWSGSHFKITARAVKRVVQRAASGKMVDEAVSACGIGCGARATHENTRSETFNVVRWLRRFWDHQ